MLCLKCSNECFGEAIRHVLSNCEQYQMFVCGDHNLDVCIKCIYICLLMIQVFEDVNVLQTGKPLPTYLKYRNAIIFRIEVKSSNCFSLTLNMI
jgi:hypothetical protein